MGVYKDKINKAKNRDELLKRIGGKNTYRWKLLGKGVYGEAYSIDTNLVVKITTSIREVETAIKLINKEFPHIYKVIDAFIMKICGQELGFIITPRYKKLTNLETQAFTNIWDTLGCMGKYKTKEEVDAFIRYMDYNKKQRLTRQLKKFKWYSMLEEIRAAGIPGDDTHYNNVMKTRGEDGKIKYILIDIST